MTKDKRTKAELLDALEDALGGLRRNELAADAMEIELMGLKADKESIEANVAAMKRSIERICQTIYTTVAIKHPRTVAFGGVSVVRYEGQLIHPGYDGDNEEVRLLKLIHDECLEALK